MYKIFSVFYSIVILILCIACESEDTYTCGFTIDRDPVPIWIDAGCTDSDIDIIAMSIEELNEMTMQLVDIPFLVVKGITENLNEFSVRCHYTEPDWYSGSEYDGHIGYADGTGIDLFFFRNPGIAENYRTAIVLHELGHIVGMDHSDDRESVMYPDIDPLHDSYHHVDKVEFCSDQD